MLHHLKKQLNDRRYGRGDTLPATSLGRNNNTGTSTSTSTGSSRWWSPLARLTLSKSGGRDGSAAAIDTVPQYQKTWQRTSVHTRTTWISVLCGAAMVWFGWRWLHYYSAGIHIDCHSVTCDLKVRPIGWNKAVHITGIARHQLVAATPIKTTKDGAFVTDQNIALIEPYRTDSNKKNHKKSASYKGPDEEGHYLSYTIIWRGKHTSRSKEPQQETEDENWVPDVDMTRLLPYADIVSNPDPDPPSNTLNQAETATETETAEETIPATDEYTYYRLIPHKFGVRESKRRVRTMIQKLESYMKRRRQKLVVRENSPPAWQAVILMVMGTMTFFIAMALGQWSDYQPAPPLHRGPGVRRNQRQPPTPTSQRPQHYTNASASSSRPKPPRDTIQEAYQSSTPSQYEVRTASTSAVKPMMGNTGAVGAQTTYRRR